MFSDDKNFFLICGSSKSFLFLAARFFFQKENIFCCKEKRILPQKKKNLYTKKKILASHISFLWEQIFIKYFENFLLLHPQRHFRRSTSRTSSLVLISLGRVIVLKLKKKIIYCSFILSVAGLRINAAER